MTSDVETQRKDMQPKHTAPPDRWYTPIQLRPWVVRAMGYRPKTGKNLGHANKSPFRQFIEEIVAEKIAEHLGAETATSSSIAAENAAEEMSATENTTENGCAAANLVHGLEETLATLSRAEEGFVYPHDSALTGAAQYAIGAAQHALDAQNSAAVEIPKPRNLASSRRKLRRSLTVSILDFLMPDLAKLDRPRRPASASASASASESVPGERLEYDVRSDTQSTNKICPWHLKWKRRDRGHKEKPKKGKYNSVSDRAGRDRRNRNKNEDRVVEAGGEANDDTSESENSSICAQVGESDDDDRLAQDGNHTASTTLMNILSSKERKTESSRGRDRSRGRS